MRLVDVIRAEIRINLEVDPNHAQKLHATTVEGWATGKQNVDPTKKQEEKNTTAVVSKEDLLYLVGEGNILNIACDDSSWIVDSGASFHVTPHGSFFSSYQSGDFGTVQMGNQDMSKIVGIGNITLTTSTGRKLILKDVRHVPTMRLNLISAGKLDNAGLMNYFGEGKWKLTKGSLVMARGKKV